MDVFSLLACISIASAAFHDAFLDVEAISYKNKHVPKRKYRPIYHVSAPDGWLSYPAGFTVYKNQYHLFYQYYHLNGHSGDMSWGHVVSENLVEWINFPTALVPKDSYDKHGCLAGTAFEHKQLLYLVYTGQAIYNNKSIKTQNVAISGDGMIFKKYLYNPVILDWSNENFDNHNPKIWQYHNTWYMILGSSSVEGRGQLLLYTSENMVQWKYNGVILQSYGDMGYSWESPDLCKIAGNHVLLLSIQELKSEFRHKNYYQTGYIVGTFDHFRNKFENMEASINTFQQLDFGHDFYAAKTLKSLDGRTLLIAWLGIWHGDFIESTYGWGGMLTLVREVRLNEFGRILMTPIREMEELRAELLEEAWYYPGEVLQAGTKHFELIVNSSLKFSEIGIVFEWETDGQFSIDYSVDNGYIKIDRGGSDGVRMAYWYPLDRVTLRIFVDYSSVELFCGDGEVVFSSRIYPASMNIRITGDSEVYIQQYKLHKSVGYNNKVKRGSSKKRLMKKHV